MADPATMMMIAAGAKAAGTAATGLMQYQTSRRNAALAEQNADLARSNAVIEGENRQRQAEKSVGAAKARAGASGFTLAGSAASVISQLAAEGNQGASTALYEGMIAGRSGDAQAKNMRRSAKFGLFATGLKVGTTLLTAGSDYKLSQRGG